MNKSTVKTTNQSLFLSCYKDISSMNTPDVKTKYTIQRLDSIVDVNIGNTYLFVLTGKNIGECHYYVKVYNRELQGFTVKLVETINASIEEFWKCNFKGIVSKVIANSPTLVLQYDKILEVYALEKAHQQATLPKTYSHA